MKIYYVCDVKNKLRIPVEFRKLSTAQKYCAQLQEKHEGWEFMSGLWVEHYKFGVNEPGEWPWAKPMQGRYMV